MKHCDQHVCISVRAYVCLSALISRKPRVQTPLNLLFMLSVVAAQSSDESTKRYVFPVWLVTSCFHITCTRDGPVDMRALTSRCVVVSSHSPEAASSVHINCSYCASHCCSACRGEVCYHLPRGFILFSYLRF